MVTTSCRSSPARSTESEREGFFHFSDDGDLVALRFDNWKVVFMEQRAFGTLRIWAGPFTPLRFPKLFNLRTDPFERADITSNTYYDWFLDRAYMIGGGADRDRPLPRDVQGLPTASEGAELHRRPGDGEAGSVVLGGSLTGKERLAVTDPLASWNDTATRQAIVGFVEAAANEIAPEERIAVFDNDGTLWCEQPMPIQADFLFGRLAEMATEDPSLAARMPWKAVVERDYDWLSGVMTKHYAGDDSDLQVLAVGLLQAYEGSTIDEVAAISTEFMRTRRHPTLDRPYLACAYLPMVELLDHLEANGFVNYIASGGGRDFMRTISQEMYGISPDRVIGSSVALEYRDGEETAQIVHTAKLDVLDDGPAKPVRIWSRVGRRPVLAAGNSNGDIPMLRFAVHPARTSLSLLVLHDDAEREFDYTGGAEAALERAGADGWTVVSVRQDWDRVFAD